MATKSRGAAKVKQLRRFSVAAPRLGILHWYGSRVLRPWLLTYAAPRLKLRNFKTSASGFQDRGLIFEEQPREPQRKNARGPRTLKSAKPPSELYFYPVDPLA